MPDSQIRRAAFLDILSTLRGISGVENVHERRKNLVESVKFEEATLEDDENRLQAWFVSRLSTQTLSSENAYGQVVIGTRLRRNHVFQIQGYYGFREQSEDAEPIDTEDEFQNLLDDVITGFNDKATYGSSFSSTPIQLVSTDYDLLGDVLCHYAILQIMVVEEVTGRNPS